MNTRVTSRFPISTDLIGPLEVLLLAMKGSLDREAFAKAMAQIAVAKQQAAQLNQLLSELQAAQQGLTTDVVDFEAGALTLSGASPSDVGSASAIGSDTAASRGDHVHRGLTSIRKSGSATSIYGNATLSEGNHISITQAGSDLEIAVEGVGVSYFLQIGGPTASVSPGTTWTPISFHTPVTGDETESLFLSFPWRADNLGVNAQYRLRSSDGVTIRSGTRAVPFNTTLELDVAAAAAMPGQGKVALEVSFSAAGSGGAIGLTGPALWRAA